MTKTRFVAHIDGVTKKLFTVREISRGALQVIIETPGVFHDSLGPTGGAVTQCKIGIYPSPKSATNANTMHKATVFADGSRQDTHLLTQAINNGSFQPLHAARVIGMDSAPVYNPPKVRVLQLGDYSTRTNTMYLAILVSAADMSPPDLHNCTALHTCFSRFALTTAVCFTGEATPEHGETIEYFTTSALKITPDLTAAGITPQISSGCPGWKVGDAITDAFNSLILGGNPALFIPSQPIPGNPLFTAQPEP